MKMTFLRVYYIIHINIQGDTEIFVQTLEASSPYLNKKKNGKYTCLEMPGLWVIIKRFHSTTKTQMSYLTSNWQNTFTMIHDQCDKSSVQLFIYSQFTTNAQNVFHLLQCTRRIMDTLSKTPRWLRMVSQAYTMRKSADRIVLLITSIE